MRFWTKWTLLHKILNLQAAFLFIKYKILLENPTELHDLFELCVQVFDIQVNFFFFCYKILLLL